MNLEEIKNKIKSNKGKNVKVVVYGLRNKKEIIIGSISDAYSNVFTVLSRGINKSFSYSDIFIGDVKIEYL